MIRCRGEDAERCGSEGVDDLFGVGGAGEGVGGDLRVVFLDPQVVVGEFAVAGEEHDRDVVDVVAGVVPALPVQVRLDAVLLPWAVRFVLAADFVAGGDLPVDDGAGVVVEQVG